jgi:hypothetical protein
MPEIPELDSVYWQSILLIPKLICVYQRLQTNASNRSQHRILITQLWFGEGSDKCPKATNIAISQSFLATDA